MRAGRPRARRHLIARFGRDRKGVSAVEFALVATPFFALLFAILETALVFLASQLMETSVADAARLVRTGQAQMQGFEAADFKAEVCGSLVLISRQRCEQDMLLDVTTYETFAAAALPQNRPPIDDDGRFDASDTYQPGVGGDIVVVRAFYVWPLVVPTFGLNLADVGSNKRLLASAATFRNEPF